MDCARLGGMRTLLPSLRHTIVLLGSLAVAGCSVFAPSLKILADSPQGTVWIEQLSARGSTGIWSGGAQAFQATHPISLNPQLIAGMLGGLRMQARKDHAPAHPQPDPTAIPVFTDDDQAFLAPAIAEALRQLAPDQRVMFQVLRSSATGSEFTTGTLFVNRPAIHITLRNFRAASPDEGETGLEGQELTFAHQEASVANVPPQSWSLVEPRRYTVAVNYETMGRLTNVEPSGATTRADRDRPAPPRSFPAQAEVTTAPAARPSSGDELQGMQAALSKQEKDMEALREELKSMRQQLTEKDAPPAKSKPIRKPAP